MGEIFSENDKSKKARDSTVTHLVFRFKMCLKHSAASSFMIEIWRPTKDFSKNIVSFLYKASTVAKKFEITTAKKFIKRRPPI